MPESSRQRKCLRSSSQEGNKANLLPLPHIKRLLFFLLYKTIMGSAQREGGLPRGGLTVASLCSTHTHIWVDTPHTHTLSKLQCRISNALAEVRFRAGGRLCRGRRPSFSTLRPNIQNMDAHPLCVFPARCCTLTSVCRDPECRGVKDSSTRVSGKGFFLPVGRHHPLITGSFGE